MERPLPGHTELMEQGQHVDTGERTSALPDVTDFDSAGPAPDSLPPGAPRHAEVPGFAVVYEQHFDFVWRSARRLGVPEASVDDVVQDVFVTVYRRLNEFEGRSQLKTWIFGILRHTISDLRRGQRRKPTSALDQEPADGRGLSPQDAAVRTEGFKLLHEALASLPDDQREVFVLAELEQLSSPEIASALDVNLNTVYSRLRAARQEFEAASKRLRSRDEWRMR